MFVNKRKVVMMKKALTVEMVMNRAKVTDISKVIKLNCWGSDLEDISLLKSLPYLEVLSLSVNKISDISPIRFCTRLKELYLRQNDISDLYQINYLKSLSSLTNLSLIENPCTQLQNYRLTVIREVPNLKKLDDIAITAEERIEANSSVAYSDRSESNENYENSDNSSDAEDVAIDENIKIDSRVKSNFAIYENQSSAFSSSTPKPLYAKKSFESENETQKYEPKEELLKNNYQNQENLTRIVEQHQIPKRSNLNCNVNQNHLINNDNSSFEIIEKNTKTCCCSSGSSKSGAVKAISERPLSRNKMDSKNKNVLSAVLSLIKELDYAYLDVVQQEIRSRMDTLKYDSD